MIIFRKKLDDTNHDDNLWYIYDNKLYREIYNGKLWYFIIKNLYRWKYSDKLWYFIIINCIIENTAIKYVFYDNKLLGEGPKKMKKEEEEDNKLYRRIYKNKLWYFMITNCIVKSTTINYAIL